jgi:hypothetical protein
VKILHDLFPVFLVVATPDHEVSLADLRSSPPTKGAYQISVARVIVTDTRVQVAVDGAKGPMVVFSEAIEPGSHVKSKDINKDSYLLTAKGKKIAYRKDNSCGCGSRLKSWNPYKHISSNADPTE